MKITKTEFAKLIKESVLRKISEVTDQMSKAQLQAKYREKGKDAARLKGVTNQEKALIDNIENALVGIAKEKNLLSGDLAMRIQKLIDLITKYKGPGAGEEAPVPDAGSAPAAPAAAGAEEEDNFTL